MPSWKDLPFLFKLLDDETPEVRTQISAALRSFGPQLESVVAEWRPQLSPDQLQWLDLLLDEMNKEQIKESWLQWLDYPDGLSSLEHGLISLSRLQYGEMAEEIPQLLDALAQRFRGTYPTGGSAELMAFLFEEEGYEPVDEAWVNFEQHHLSYVFRYRRGSALALSCLAMLVGQRVGMSLYNIRIRGHFMAMALDRVKVEMYNPMERGKPLSRSSAIFMEEAMRRNLTWPREMQVHAFEVVLTVLNCGKQHLQHQEKLSQAETYRKRHWELKQELKRRGWL